MVHIINVTAVIDPSCESRKNFWSKNESDVFGQKFPVLDFGGDHKKAEEFIDEISSEKRDQKIPSIAVIKRSDGKYEVIHRDPFGRITKQFVTKDFLLTNFSARFCETEISPNDCASLFNNSIVHSKVQKVGYVFTDEVVQGLNPFLIDGLEKFLNEENTYGSPIHQNKNISTITISRSQKEIDGKIHNCVSVACISSKEGPKKFTENTAYINVGDHGKIKCFVGEDGTITIRDDLIFKMQKDGSFIGEKPTKEEKEAMDLTDIKAVSVLQKNNGSPDEVRSEVKFNGKRIYSNNTPSLKTSGATISHLNKSLISEL